MRSRLDRTAGSAAKRVSRKRALSRAGRTRFPAEPDASALSAEPDANALPAEPDARAFPAEPDANAHPGRPQPHRPVSAFPAEPDVNALPAGQPQARSMPSQLQARPQPSQALARSRPSGTLARSGRRKPSQQGANAFNGQGPTDGESQRGGLAQPGRTGTAPEDGKARRRPTAWPGWLPCRSRTSRPDGLPPPEPTAHHAPNPGPRARCRAPLDRRTQPPAGAVPVARTGLAQGWISAPVSNGVPDLVPSPELAPAPG